ncbi:glycosyltransferase [Hahella sp. CCB-MM4]|uniref:tRNA-queuosine alpha-mannosyltransferase domain-containing protein n=1 Tax=Hahella sp. (strain CCB-MM4) TaxID=1926491 RepID=UPI000B9BD1DE|nr:DUF3524 domain-containing protein [Hahella sp. CCB-MM4]OZG72254.1 glycosyltransferase [Hahella sp. CCB-MM4]
MARILLLSAYDIDSHRSWREGLVEHLGEHEWTVLTLPARHFRWRIRGNPINWWMTRKDDLSRSYDLVIATSMVDCATLRGLFPNLIRSRWVVYFHENQLAYPVSDEQHSSIDPAVVNVYSAMACDHVVFNSQHNRHSFISGLEGLIDRLPDFVDKTLSEAVAGKSSVIPVPLQDDLFQDEFNHQQEGTVASRQLPTIVWNHRVEYDKGLDELYAILAELRYQTREFRLLLLGKRFRQHPEVFQRIADEFHEHIVVNAYAGSRREYLSWLQRSDVVLSTALHEFQGLSVMEAVALGCRPVVPDRLSYPEMFPASCRYDSVSQAVELIRTAFERPVISMQRFSWSSMIPLYRDLVNGDLINGS